MPYPSPSGSTNGYSPLPDGWAVSVINGQYTISYNGEPIQQSNSAGTMLANSVTTGVGSFHLGQAHAIGSAGQNVTFKNNQTNVCWFPVWQGQSADGTTIYNPQARTFQAQQTLKLNGEVNLSGTPVPYMVTDTMTGNLSFTSISLYPSETYAGALTWTVTYTPSGIQVANVRVTGCTSGTLLTIPLEYPLDARTGDPFTVTITKADGSTLNAYPGTTRPSEAYRGLVCRPFTDSIVWNQSNIGAGLKVSGSNLTVDLSQIEATTTSTGTIQLAGDLGGTAKAPIVSKMGGATVPASSPTASGQYHRSSSTSATAWSSIQASDLPAASSSTQGAVKVGGVTPQALGNTASAGTSTVSAAADHIHPIPTFAVNMGLVSDGNGRTTASATTAAEIAVLSGATASQTPIITDTDAVVFNDGGVMKQLRVDALSNYVKSAYTAGGLTPYMTQKLPQDKILASDANGDMQALNITPATLATFVGQNTSSKQTRQATTYTYIAFQALRGLLFKFNIAQSSTNLVVSSTSGDTLRYVVRYGHQSLNPIISTATFSQNTEFMTLGTSSGRGWFVDGMVYSTTDESKYLRFSLIAVDETATLQYINCQIW